MNRVFVAMSGGVDSAVAAALLKKAEFGVTGVFIRGWQAPPELAGACDWREERREAMRAAAQLGVNFLTLDLSKQYQRLVIDQTIRDYRAGRTPNPDVLCNKEIKFGLFFDWARRQGAHMVATGHHVRHLGVKLPSLGSLTPKLLVGRDQNKDQSYFLWTLTQQQLRHCLFPIGDYQKPQVRRLARQFGLPNADKHDSQGLCFVGQIEVKDFLRPFIKPRRGLVLNLAGEEIGHHDGAALYTIGERHGFTVTARDEASSPHYVVATDVHKNTITVSPRPLDAGAQKFKLRDINWISGQWPDLNKSYSARARYRASLTSCRLTKTGTKTAEVDFAGPIISARGQSVVFYDGAVCLGGGVIELML